jgi:hypothetical protein
VLVWEDVLPAERRVDAYAERFGEGDELLSCMTCSAAGYQNRAARLGDPAGDPPGLLGPWHGLKLMGGAQPIIRSWNVLAQHIRGEGEHNRSGTPRGGDP